MTAQEFNDWLNVQLDGNYSPGKVAALKDKIIAKNFSDAYLIIPMLDSMIEHKTYAFGSEAEKIDLARLV